jgi:hypothetical protein
MESMHKAVEDVLWTTAGTQTMELYFFGAAKGEQAAADVFRVIGAKAVHPAKREINTVYFILDKMFLLLLLLETRKL